MDATVVSFAGMTHLGIISAIATAAKGFSVVGYDGDEGLVRRLDRQDLSILEPDLDRLLVANRDRIRFSNTSSDVSACDVVYIAADVPTNDAGESDLVPIAALVDGISRHLRDDAILVVLCQVPPGFTRSISSEPHSRLFYQVETLIFGRAVEQALNPERFIVGCADPEKPLPPRYREILDAFGCPILPMRYESAELAKISINFCFVASVTVANVLAELSESIGADWAEIVPALRLDRRVGQYSYLSPGLGIAGGNLERDLRTVLNLAGERGTDVGVVNAWIANSRRRRDWCWGVLQERVVNSNPTARIGVLGLAYKEHTHSTKNSPALALLGRLRRMDLRVHDPVDPPAIVTYATGCSEPLACAEGADALVLTTPWLQYRELQIADLARLMTGRVLIDPYRLLNGGEAAAAGFEYHSLGMPPLGPAEPGTAMLVHGNDRPVMPKRAVVMGAGGFVGNAIACRLERDRVLVLRLTRRDVDLLAADGVDRLAARLRPGDVLVAVSALAPCRNAEMLRDNIIMVAAMLRAAAAEPLAFVVNISSDAVYADSAAPLSEASVKAPESLHGVMHLAREIMFTSEKKAPLAILRPTLIYGAADPHNGFGPNRFWRLARSREPIKPFGKGEERRDHVSIYDVAELAACVIYRRSVGALNIATGTVTSFREIAEMVLRISNWPVPIEEMPRTGPMPHNGYRAFDTTSCRAAFPDFSFVPLQNGLAEMARRHVTTATI